MLDYDSMPGIDSGQHFEQPPSHENESAAKTAREFAADILRKQIEPLDQAKEGPANFALNFSPETRELIWNPQLLKAKRDVLKLIGGSGERANGFARDIIEGELAKTAEKLRKADNREMIKGRWGTEPPLNEDTRDLQARMAELQKQLDAIPETKSETRPS